MHSKAYAAVFLGVALTAVAALCASRGQKELFDNSSSSQEKDVLEEKKQIIENEAKARDMFNRLRFSRSSLLVDPR